MLTLCLLFCTTYLCVLDDIADTFEIFRVFRIIMAIMVKWGGRLRMGRAEDGKL